MSKKINFDSNHKKAENVTDAIGRIWDNIAPYFIITAVIADLAVGTFFLVKDFDESLKRGDLDPKDDKAIVMEIDGETVALPLYSYKKNLSGDLVIKDTEGNTYTVPKDSESTLVLGDDALNRANELVSERALENGGRSL